ncbi:MAG: hypothetical protein FJ263_09015 [Planctomycetes bacterium]|nr:hypothetical protein [Planctomycetota bacterium]
MAEMNEPEQKASLKKFTAIIVWAGIAVFAFYSSTHMVAAGDTWVALACGRHHANHGVKPVEPFSFNSHKAGPSDEQLKDWPQWTHGIIRTIHPTGWINQNWLTHVVFYELVHLFGSEDNPNYNMLVVWKFALFFATAYVVYAYGRVMGVCPLPAAAASCLAMVVGRTFFDIRPACWSNFFVPLFLLILALAVYKNIRTIWLMVPMVVLWANFHGGYIYVYMMMVPFVGLHLISMMSRNRLVKIPFRNLLTICYAAIASFIAMIIFNPYHLTNLTHTFEISISEHAASWRNVKEWRPAFAFLDKGLPNGVGDTTVFGAMCILFFAALGVWLVSQKLRPRIDFGKKAKPADIERGYKEWPKIDLPMLAIALLTTYMATQSRRFVAIAGSVACPMIFLLLQQAWDAITARIRYRQGGNLERMTPPVWLQNGALALYGLFALGCGVFWGLEFKKIYLDPWPEDSVYHSVFMRMTASNVKPIDVCKFINANHLSGRMFNYWTEGGAIAFGQKPDPKTGEIPLKLFMDGRAQAAYNHDKFQLWQYIYYGGPAAQRVHQPGKKPSEADYRPMTEWIEQQLGQYGVWVILIPRSELSYSFEQKDYLSGYYFTNALRYSGHWKTAYYDSYQLMMVDIRTVQGQRLIDDILSGKAKFPNPVAQDLTLCHLIPEQYSSALAGKLEQAAVDAFHLCPAPITFDTLVNIGTAIKKTAMVVQQVDAYLADFELHIEQYRRQNGYADRLYAAWRAADYLSQFQPDRREEMARKAERFKVEKETFSGYALW